MVSQITTPKGSPKKRLLVSKFPNCILQSKLFQMLLVQHDKWEDRHKHISRSVNIQVRISGGDSPLKHVGTEA